MVCLGCNTRAAEKLSPSKFLSRFGSHPEMSRNVPLPMLTGFFLPCTQSRKMLAGCTMGILEDGQDSLEEELEQFNGGRG